jgi:hypothetical protein
MNAIDAGFRVLKGVEDLDDLPDENKGGSCYHNAYNYMCANPNHTLVHAQVSPTVGPLAGRSYGHAFTTFMGEDGKKMVHDPSSGMTLPADVFYGIGQISAPNMVEYTQEEMFRQAVESETSGPWDAMADEWTHSKRREEE